MQAPKLYPDDLDASDFRQMEALISEAIGGAPVALDQDRVADLVDILMPRGVAEPIVTEATPGRMIATLWPDSAGRPPSINPVELTAAVRSTLDDWHLLH